MQCASAKTNSASSNRANPHRLTNDINLKTEPAKPHGLAGSFISANELRRGKFDSNASIAYIHPMSTTLTIRNLAEPVKQKLRLRAATNGRSMEAEAREILSAAVLETSVTPPRTPEEMRARLEALAGTWKKQTGGKSTDEIMKELRGDDDD